MEIDLQKVKITVDLGDGTSWVYDNINSIIAEDKLISLEDPNSTIHILNIEALSVNVKKIEKAQEDKYKKFTEDVESLIKNLNINKAEEENKSKCNGNCENCENGCQGNCCC